MKTASFLPHLSPPKLFSLIRQGSKSSLCCLENPASQQHYLLVKQNRSWLRRVVSQKRPQAASNLAMASDLDFSPPEVPEPTFLENLLRYGLFLGAIFQLICVLAIIVPIPKSYEVVSFSLGASAPLSARLGSEY
nr:uncharacterized protein LOC105732159 isoform X1 [Aotus nancymaae]